MFGAQLRIWYARDECTTIEWKKYKAGELYKKYLWRYIFWVMSNWEINLTINVIYSLTMSWNHVVMSISMANVLK